MDYLVYVTHDAENLQFYLWMADYCRRFKNAPKKETDLSPKWTLDERRPSLNHAEDLSYRISDSPMTSSGARETDLNETEDISSVSTLGDQQSCDYPRTMSWKTSTTSDASFNSMTGSRRQSYNVQPFRSEIERIVSHYIIPGSPRELNLSHKDRRVVLQALQQTTHPSALSIIKNMLDMTLRNRAHPNFIRWSICNGNTPRTFFLRGFAVMNITIGFIVATLLTLSSVSRWFRITAAVEWWFGITNFIAASQGLCILLHRRHTRNIRPWEISGTGHQRKYSSDDLETVFRGGNVEYSETKSRWPVKMQVFGPSNNYLKESWIEKDQLKPMWNKIKDRKVKVQETGLRIMQNKIVLQAEAWALILTIPITAGFVALPKGNFY